MSILMGVKWLKAVMVFVFVGAFALATNHCRLEVLKGLELLVCCSHEGEADPAGPHQDDDCETDGCASLEGGLYKSEDGRVTTTAPLVALEAFLPNDEQLGYSAPSPEFFTFAPPELPASWQFLLRVASPPRAPSVVS